MSQSIFPGPIAPENNPPITPQYYQPSVFYISDISLGETTTITTSVDHNYVVGQLVRLLIPFTFGSVQLNEAKGNVISIPDSDEVVLNIDSSLNVNPFIPIPAYGPTPPQIIAVGDYNSGQINAGRSGNITYPPGAFINISPI